MSSSKECEFNSQLSDRAEVLRYIEMTTSKIQTRQKMRDINSNIEWPTCEYFINLDSSMKKNSSFVKKLRQFTAQNMDSLMKDIDELNLTRYISEVSVALAEAKIKVSDIPSCVLLCAKLHSIYSEFSSHFLDNWQKTLAITPNEKIVNSSKLRVDIRFFSELLCNGLFPIKIGLSILGSALVGIINQDKNDHAHVSVIISFCKHCGDEYAGLISHRLLELASAQNVIIPRSSFLPQEKQHNLRSLLKDYYRSLAHHLKLEHKDLQNAERQRLKQIEAKGEFAHDKQEQLQILQINYERLLSSTKCLSDLLGEPMPELTIENTSSNEQSEITGLVEEPLSSKLDPWGDEETKMFYNDLPNLHDLLPSYSIPVAMESSGITEEAVDAEDELALENIKDTMEQQKECTDGNIYVASISQSKQSFDLLLHNLVNCVNKELADSAAMDFLLNFNSKPYRKRLIRTLYGVHRTRLDLLPMYGRIIAVINLVAPDVTLDICQLLKKDLKYQLAKRDQINIESKIKVVRFIGELVKFGLFPKFEALTCLKLLLYNFQHHQIEMACAFFEVCGQYLYNCQDSRAQTHAYLEKMMRFKTVQSLDPRHSAQIENCYYLVKPPDVANCIVEEKSPIFRFMKYLLYEQLNKHNVDTIVRLVRRFDYDDPVVCCEIVKCLTKAYKARYNLIKSLADVLAGLLPYQEKIVLSVIDNVIEDIRCGLEINSSKLSQRQVAMVTYLGEMYNYRLITSNDVISTLYLIISLGVTFDHDMVESETDPPLSMFRLKLACILLNTSGPYITRSSHKKRLDYFIVFMQHYYWFKKSFSAFETDEKKDCFPVLIDQMYKECLLNLRPKLTLFKSFDEAKVAVKNLQDVLYPYMNDNDKKTDQEISIMQMCLNSDSDTEDNICDINEYDHHDEHSEDELSPHIDNNCDRNIILQGRKPRIPQEEKSQDDLEFERMFDKVTQDSYQERLKETKLIVKEISIPTTSKNTKKTYEQLQDPEANVSYDSVSFTLLLRGSKTGKNLLRAFRTPIEDQMAQNLMKQKEMLRKEDERVKRLTLNITERIEEEDYQDSLQQTQKVLIQQKQRVHKNYKFKHQKGAPDADSIFS